MTPSVSLANPERALHIGVIVLGGVTEMLDVAPIDLLHGISSAFIDRLPDSVCPPALKAQALKAEFHWVSEMGSAKTSHLTSGMALNVTDSFETCPPLDIVLIGAAFDCDITDAELAYIRKSYAECAAFITVCAGIEAPVKAGILAGKTATAPRFMLDELRQAAPETHWVEQRWAQDGKLWTSGALLNGLDLMSAFVHATWPSGEGTLVQHMERIGAWPLRDQGYIDVSWKE